MTCDHVGVELSAESFCQNNGVEEDGGLGNLGLLQVLVGAFEHKVGYAEAEYLVGFLKHFASYLVGVVQVFSHAHKLCALSGKYKCFHVSVMIV